MIFLFGLFLSFSWGVFCAYMAGKTNATFKVLWLFFAIIGGFFTSVIFSIWSK